MWRTSKYSGGAAIAATDAVGVVEVTGVTGEVVAAGEATGVGVKVAREVMTNLAWQKDDVDDGGKVYYVSSYSEPFTRSDFIEAPAVPSGRGFGFYASISFKSEGTRTNRRWPYFTYSSLPAFTAT